MTKNLSTTFSTGYMDRALDDLPAIVAEGKARLADVDFDTLVGTGFSGGIVIPSLAMALGKQFVLIRKETDDSHHGPGKLLGNLGKRWLFVDDFVSSGATRRRVVDKVLAACVMHDHRTTFVGQYMYAAAHKQGEWNPNTCAYEGVEWGLYSDFSEFAWSFEDRISPDGTAR